MFPYNVAEKNRREGKMLCSETKPSIAQVPLDRHYYCRRLKEVLEPSFCNKQNVLLLIFTNKKWQDKLQIHREI